MLGHDDKPFRVLVIGGGVAGLIASHALHKAGIDHVVLEKSDEPAPAWGASIAMYPNGCRILEQLGCLHGLNMKCKPADRYVNRMPNGKVCLILDYWKQVQEK
jgi:2-polyprenyl-6-methoxyphenol hydroxylase-like FAD-dependent oxidoreductase